MSTVASNDLVEIDHCNVVLDDAILQDHPLTGDGIRDAEVFEQPPNRIRYRQRKAGQKKGRQKEECGDGIGLPFPWLAHPKIRSDCEEGRRRRGNSGVAPAKNGSSAGLPCQRIVSLPVAVNNYVDISPIGARTTGKPTCQRCTRQRVGPACRLTRRT